MIFDFFSFREFTDIVSNYYFNEAYIKTHMKLITYFMGILTAFVLHRIQTEKWVIFLQYYLQNKYLKKFEYTYFMVQKNTWIVFIIQL